MGANSPDPLCELSEARPKHQREVEGRTDPEIRLLIENQKLRAKSGENIAQFPYKFFFEQTRKQIEETLGAPIVLAPPKKQAEQIQPHQMLNSQIRLQQQSTPKSGVKRKVEETSPLYTPAKKDRVLSPQGDSSPWSGSVLSPLGEDWLPVTRRRKSAPKSKTPLYRSTPNHQQRPRLCPIQLMKTEQNSTKWKIKLNRQKKINTNIIFGIDIYYIFSRRQNMFPNPPY